VGLGVSEGVGVCVCVCVCVCVRCSCAPTCVYTYTHTHTHTHTQPPLPHTQVQGVSAGLIHLLALSLSPPPASPLHDNTPGDPQAPPPPLHSPATEPRGQDHHTISSSRASSWDPVNIHIPSRPGLGTEASLQRRGRGGGGGGVGQSEWRSICWKQTREAVEEDAS